MQESSKIFRDRQNLGPKSLKTLEILERFLQGDYIWNTYTLIWLTGTGLGVVQKLSLGLKGWEQMIIHKSTIFKLCFTSGKWEITVAKWEIAVAIWYWLEKKYYFVLALCCSKATWSPAWRETKPLFETLFRWNTMYLPISKKVT